MGGLGLVAVALVAFAAWYFLIRGDTPPPVSLAKVPTAADAGTPVAPANLSGAWVIGSGSGSFAGYRVQENLVAFGSKTAVGRTESVQGLLQYDGRSIVGLTVTADLTALKSDQSLRDDTLKTQAIQSCRFPGATFTISAPIADLGNDATTGGTVTKTVPGSLTLHGVTKPVSMAVKGQLRGGQVVVVGSTDIKFSDYDIAQPRSVAVVSLDDHGTMEFQLIFQKATTAAGTPAPVSTPTSGCSGGFPGGGPPPGGGGGPPPGGPPPGGGAPGGLPGINTPGPVPAPVN